MISIKENKKESQVVDTHFNHDESFYHHLKDIKFDIFLTVHFKYRQLYSKTNDSHCNRNRFFREAFGNLTRYLEIPHKALFYFGIAESDCNNRMHCHLLLKFRKDLIFSEEEMVNAIQKIYLLDWESLRYTKNHRRSVEKLDHSQDATNYILKIKTFDEKQSNTKDFYYHSKNFIQICDYMKAGKW